MRKSYWIVLFAFITAVFVQNGASKVAEKDSIALLYLYKSTDGANWLNHENWATNQPVDEWYGITVTDSRVTKIELGKNNLVGKIPPEIAWLDVLSELTLFSNKLSDVIPNEICELKNLTFLNLAGNNLSGKIPEDIGQMVSLSYLYLSENNFDSEIPGSMGKLEYLLRLYLDNNNLEGEIPLTLTELSHLTFLMLNDNQLQGKIPEELAKLSNLSQLKLQNNRFEGEIPEALGKLQYLDILDLQDNYLSGAVPESFNKLIKLRMLYISNNRIVDLPNLSGMTNIVKFYASNNRLTFEDLEENELAFGDKFSYLFQDSIGKNRTVKIMEGSADSISVSTPGTANFYQWYKNGQYIRGATNRVYVISSAKLEDAGSYICRIGNTIATGTMLYSRAQKIKITKGIQKDSLALVALYAATDSAGWTNKWDLNDLVSTWTGIKIDSDRVVALNLAHNNLKGTIPDEIADLTELKELVLSGGDYSAGISDSLGALDKLEYLDLSYSNISHKIPESVMKLKNLRTLYITNCEIGDSIPTSLADLDSIKYISLVLNNLEGEIPVELGNLKNLESLMLRNNKLSGAVPQSFINLSNLKELAIYNNRLEDLPDLSGLEKLVSLRVFNNKLTFEDLEPNITISKFSYSPQDSVSEALDTTLSVGDSLKLIVDVGGSVNVYQWMKDDIIIEGATDSVYTISSVALEDSGSYVCQITNTLATKLTLYSRPAVIHTKKITGIADKQNNALPREYALKQNYPNPFNPSTKISFSLPEAVRVTINVYNLLGQRVAVLLDTQKSAGNHSIIFNAENLSAGMYLYEIRANNFYQIKKMLLVK